MARLTVGGVITGNFDCITLAEILANGNESDGTKIIMSTDDKICFRDSGIFIHSNADGEMTIEADSKVSIGVAGNIELGDSTERTIQPQTDLKMNLGATTNRFNEGHFGAEVFMDAPLIRAQEVLGVADTLDNTHFHVFLDNASATTYTLSDGTDIEPGTRYTITKTATGANMHTIDSNGTNINGQDQVFIQNNYSSFTVEWDGTEYWIVGTGGLWGQRVGYNYGFSTAYTGSQLLKLAGNGNPASTNNGYVATGYGRVKSLSLMYDCTVYSSGTIQIEAFKNNTATQLAISSSDTPSVTNGLKHHDVSPTQNSNFIPGDSIQCQVTFSGGASMTLSHAAAVIEVEYF